MLDQTPPTIFAPEVHNDPKIRSPILASDIVLVPDFRDFRLRPSACPRFPGIFASDLVLVPEPVV